MAKEVSMDELKGLSEDTGIKIKDDRHTFWFYHKGVIYFVRKQQRLDV